MVVCGSVGVLACRRLYSFAYQLVAGCSSFAGVILWREGAQIGPPRRPRLPEHWKESWWTTSKQQPVDNLQTTGNSSQTNNQGLFSLEAGIPHSVSTADRQHTRQTIQLTIYDVHLGVPLPLPLPMPPNLSIMQPSPRRLMAQLTGAVRIDNGPQQCMRALWINFIAGRGKSPGLPPTGWTSPGLLPTGWTRERAQAGPAWGGPKMN